jgi:hypothetical protein
LESLERRMMLDGAMQATISEFVAANNNGLRDEDGHTSDWIEIHNPTDETIDLAGWHLTDDDTQLDKWTFPTVEITPDDFLVVFASRKDRALAGDELHTNFQLGSGGEYLALTQPDRTIVSQFGPQYPTQFSNTSYGAVANSRPNVLLDTNAAARVLIPTDGSLGNSWTGGSEPFDDSTWIGGLTGIGFDTTEEIPESVIGYWPLDNSAEDTSGNRADAILNGTGYQANVPAAIGAGESLQLDGINDSVDLGDVGMTGGTIAMWIHPTDVGEGLGNRRLLSHVTGAVNQAGSLGIDPNNTLGDGSLWIWTGATWLRLTADDVLQSNQWQHLSIVAEGGQVTAYLDGQPHNTVASNFDFDGPNMVFGAPFLQVHGNPFAGNVDDLSLWETALTPAEIQVLAAGSAPAGSALAPLIGTDVEATMHGENASAYLRVEFDVAVPGELVQLSLQMKYDDGYIAYLNGQEIARENATGIAAWNQAADQPRADEDVIQFQDVDITQHIPLLTPGTNVLAIQGLNVTSADEDFLILPRLINHEEALLPCEFRYFSVPTPGAQNGVVAADIGPIISQVSEPTGALAATDELPVTATVTTTFDGLDEVLLYYRAMYGPELSLVMLDDGQHGDGPADDGVFGATIPAGVAAAGQMVRYRFAASDNEGNTSRWPVFADPLAAAEYLGTIVDEAITSSLPVLHWFTDNPAASSSRSGARASLFYDGEFYDNVLVHGRGAGGTSAGLKFEMNRGADFRYSDTAPRVQEFNTRKQAFGKIPEVIAYEIYRDAQTPSSNSFPMRFQLNGSFAGVDVFIEQVDQTYVERNGLDGDGSLFKMFNSLTDPVDRSYSFYRNDNSKRTRDWDPTWDLDELVAGVDENNPDRNRYVADNVDIPAMINYLAATVLSGDYDHETHNFFTYRDNEGTGRWQFLPWDRNIAFFTAANDPTSHPFLGSSEYVHLSWACLEGKCDEQWNRLTDAIYDNPVTREMYLRRLRTLMDELLQSPGTPLADLKLETRLDELSAQLQSEDASLAAAASSLKNIVAVRRNHLYTTHSVDNLGNYPDAAGIPHAQAGNPQINFGDLEFNPPSGNQDEEFIRLDNPNDLAVDISHWELTGGVRHTFRPGTVIPAGGSLYVSPDVRSFLNRATGPSGGQELFVQGNYNGHLSNAGEELVLSSADGQVVSTMTYEGDPSLSQQHLRISEVNYNPYAPSLDEVLVDPNLDNDQFEYVELVNTGPAALPLDGVQFTQGIQFAFENGTSLDSGDRMLVVRDQAAFELRYGTGFNIAGEFSAGKLSNSGETIKLEDPTLSTIVEFTYDDSGQWPELADGRGASLEVIDADGDLNDPSNWRSSTEFNGSPGADGVGPIVSIVINEVLSHTDPPTTDTIEFYNTTGETIDLSGWYLSDSTTNYLKYEFPDGTELEDDAYLFIDEADFNSSGGVLPTDFALDSAHGDQLYLMEATAEDQLVHFIDVVRFGATANGESIGRWPNGDGDLLPMVSNTFGATNSGPRIGPVLINEVHYHPVDPGSGTNPDDLEFIEVYNPTESSVVLTNWVLAGGIDFAFLAGQSLSGGELLVLVSFDPENVANTDLLAEFRAVYEIDESVRLMGPYSGRLGNGGDQVQLLRPDAPPAGEPDFIPLLLEDQISYSDQPPWPTAADGTGASLRRAAAVQAGNDAASWQADDPTPGSLQSAPRVMQTEINVGIEDPLDLPKGPAPTNWQTQRSLLSTIQLTFSEPVVATAADFVLTNLGVDAGNDPDVVVQLTEQNVVFDGVRVRLTFEQGDLTNGVYELQVLPTLTDFGGVALDGDGDGTEGDAFLYTGDRDNKFYTLVSDWNGDQGVSVFDFTTFSYWFGTAVPRAPIYADPSGDGGVSVFDFTNFSAQFGKGVTFPALAVETLARQALAREPLVPTVEINDRMEVVPNHDVPIFIERREPTHVEWLRIEREMEIHEELLDLLADDVLGNRK